MKTLMRKHVLYEVGDVGICLDGYSESSFRCQCQILKITTTIWKNGCGTIVPVEHAWDFDTEARFHLLLRPIYERKTGEVVYGDCYVVEFHGAMMYRIVHITNNPELKGILKGYAYPYKFKEVHGNYHNGWSSWFRFPCINPDAQDYQNELTKLYDFKKSLGAVFE